MRTILIINILFVFSYFAKAQELGIAAFYADEFAGKKTANGELYDPHKLSAAHKTLPFGTIVRVTRLDNKKWVELRINDRGPYIKGRIIDISRDAANILGVNQDVKVRVDVVRKADGTETPIATAEPDIASTDNNSNSNDRSSKNQEVLVARGDEPSANAVDNSTIAKSEKKIKKDKKKEKPIEKKEKEKIEKGKKRKHVRHRKNHHQNRKKSKKSAKSKKS